MQSVFGFLSFGVGVLLIYNYFNGSRGQIRVIATERTLAIKLRNKPATFLKRDNCVAYGPVKCVFVMEDGGEFSLHDIDIPFQNVKEINMFIFSHWWSEEILKALEDGMEETLPMPHWHLRAIQVGFLLVFPTLAMAMILLNVGEGGLHWFFGVIFMGLVNMIVLLRLLNIVGARNQERSDYRVYLSDDFGYGDGFSIEPTRYPDMEQS